MSGKLYDDPSINDDVTTKQYVEHTGEEPLLQFFAYTHLPNELQLISSRFHRLAIEIVAALPRNPERTVALRKLLEAKDCAVRARIMT
jgi:hypothetical protein